MARLLRSERPDSWRATIEIAIGILTFADAVFTVSLMLSRTRNPVLTLTVMPCGSPVSL